MELDDDNFLVDDSTSEESPINHADYWGREFLEAYVAAGDRHSFENDHLHVGTALGLLSQAVGNATFYVGDSEQIAKVHPLMIQGSGTGKDPAFGFAKLVARAADLRMQDVNDVTGAGLVGTVSDGEPKAGLAETADIIGFREATNLFDAARQDHSPNLAENLNQILDGGEVMKKLAEGEVNYSVDCTLIGTSYEPTNLDLAALMTNGTLARFFYFFQPKDSDFRWQMAERLIEESTSSTDPAAAAKRIQALAKTLEVIDKVFHEDTQFSISAEITELQVTDRLRRIYDEYDLATKELVRPAITRYNIHFLRVSCLMAALDECSTTVRREHGELAWELIEESWRNFLEFFQQNAGEDSDESGLRGAEIAILRELISEDELTQSELAEATDYSKRTIRDRTTVLEMQNLIETGKDGREKVYRLAEER